MKFKKTHSLNLLSLPEPVKIPTDLVINLTGLFVSDFTAFN